MGDIAHLFKTHYPFKPHKEFKRAFKNYGIKTVFADAKAKGILSGERYVGVLLRLTKERNEKKYSVPKSSSLEALKLDLGYVFGHLNMFVAIDGKNKSIYFAGGESMIELLHLRSFNLSHKGMEIAFQSRS